jgi:hypothetical protein
MSISYEEAETAAQMETQEFSSDAAINRKVKLAVSGLQASFQRMVSRFPSDKDKELVADFLLACMQQNIAIKLCSS